MKYIDPPHRDGRHAPDWRKGLHYCQDARWVWGLNGDRWVPEVPMIHIHHVQVETQHHHHHNTRWHLPFPLLPPEHFPPTQSFIHGLGVLVNIGSELPDNSSAI